MVDFQLCFFSDLADHAAGELHRDLGTDPGFDCVLGLQQGLGLDLHFLARPKEDIVAFGKDRMPEVDRKWEMNRFLLKWLKFCAFQGHLFLSVNWRKRAQKNEK